MWPRVVEVMLGVWLSLSPFIFGHEADQTLRWATDFGCASALITISLLSFWKPLRRIYLLNVIVGLWLCVFGWYWEGYPTPPALQNDLIIGLCVLMFAILPSEASLPPPAWRRAERL